MSFFTTKTRKHQKSPNTILFITCLLWGLVFWRFGGLISFRNRLNVKCSILDLDSVIQFFEAPAADCGSRHLLLMYGTDSYRYHCAQLPTFSILSQTSLPQFPYQSLPL